MATWKAVTISTWEPIPPELRGAIIFLSLQSTGASDSATFDVYGSVNGGQAAVPLGRVDTQADALAVTLTTAAAKPTGTTKYSAAVRLLLQGASSIYIRQTGAPSAATYLIGGPLT